MLLSAAAALLGLLLLAVAADHLVIGAGRVAEGLGISPIVVGVVVIGLGTSAPEFIVSGLASARGDTELALANLVGSNILNMTLVLGVAALVAPVVARAGVLRREAPLSVAAVVLLAVLSLAGLGVASGVALFTALIGAMVMLTLIARSRPADVISRETAEFLDKSPAAINIRRETVRTLLGLAGTLTGAQLLVANAAAIATRLGASPALVGFTLVALGTSLPELGTAIQAQRRGDADLVVGNLLGSNLFNSVAGGAVVALVGHAHPARLGYPVLLAMATVSMLAWALLRRGNQVTRWEAILLLAAYVLTIPLIT